MLRAREPNLRQAKLNNAIKYISVEDALSTGPNSEAPSPTQNIETRQPSHKINTPHKSKRIHTQHTGHKGPYRENNLETSPRLYAYKKKCRIRFMSCEADAQNKITETATCHAHPLDSGSVASCGDSNEQPLDYRLSCI